LILIKESKKLSTILNIICADSKI